MEKTTNERQSIYKMHAVSVDKLFKIVQLAIDNPSKRNIKNAIKAAENIFLIEPTIINLAQIDENLKGISIYEIREISIKFLFGLIENFFIENNKQDKKNAIKASKILNSPDITGAIKSYRRFFDCIKEY
jgi:hypothetical protein